MPSRQVHLRRVVVRPLSDHLITFNTSTLAALLNEFSSKPQKFSRRRHFCFVLRPIRKIETKAATFKIFGTCRKLISNQSDKLSLVRFGAQKKPGKVAVYDDRFAICQLRFFCMFFLTTYSQTALLFYAKDGAARIFVYHIMPCCDSNPPQLSCPRLGCSSD